MPDIMQMVHQQLSRLNSNLQQQIRNVTGGSNQSSFVSNSQVAQPFTNRVSQTAQQARFQASNQISQSAAPAGGPGPGNAPPAQAGGGIMQRLGPMASRGYSMMGGHVGMGIMAASMILPAMMMRGGGQAGGQNQMAELERDANRASTALSRLNLNLQMTARATGTTPGGLVASSAMYAAVGVSDSLGMARNLAAQQAAYSGSIAMGQPNMGAMTGYAMMGMDPMAPTRMRPDQLQNAVIDQLRGMSPEMRGSHRVRGAMMATGMSQEQIGAMMAQANLSQQDRNYSLMLQAWVRRAQDSPENEILTRRQQNIAEINAYAQARAHNVEMTKAYLRAGGRETPIMAGVRDQITEQVQRAQIQFWLSMQPMLERLRDIFSDLIKPGGGIATFGDVISFMADQFAKSMSIAVGAAVMFAGSIGATLNVPITGVATARALGRGDFRGAYDALRAGAGRQQRAHGIVAGGGEIVTGALTEGTYDPEEVNRLMGQHGNPNAPYEQAKVVVQGVPVDELLSRGYRRGEQTGRMLPGSNQPGAVYTTVQP